MYKITMILLLCISPLQIFLCCLTLHLHVALGSHCHLLSFLVVLILHLCEDLVSLDPKDRINCHVESTNVITVEDWWSGY